MRISAAVEVTPLALGLWQTYLLQFSDAREVLRQRVRRAAVT